MSKLIVEVCKISKIETHPKADRLEIATIKGWNCIVGLDDFKVGDLCIFCPPDCIIPENIIDKYKLEHLRKNGKVKTVKLRGYISQGLILSIPQTPSETNKAWKEGQDVANELGITKYKPPLRTGTKKGGITSKKKRNPLFDKYTDIENIKNYNKVFEEGELVVITEKIHGTNFRAGNLLIYKNNLWGKILSFLFGEYEFVYGSHNIQKTVTNKKMGFYGEDVYGKIAKKYSLKEIIPKEYIIYGEIYGAGIQELEYGRKNIDVVFFDVKYKGKYLDYSDFKAFCEDRKLPKAPIIGCGNYRAEYLTKATGGNSKICPSQIREGCVIRPVKETYDHKLGRKILKSINPEYLARKNRTEFR